MSREESATTELPSPRVRSKKVQEPTCPPEVNRGLYSGWPRSAAKSKPRVPLSHDAGWILHGSKPASREISAASQIEGRAPDGRRQAVPIRDMLLCCRVSADIVQPPAPPCHAYDSGRCRGGSRRHSCATRPRPTRCVGNPRLVIDGPRIRPVVGTHGGEQRLTGHLGLPFAVLDHRQDEQRIGLHALGGRLL